MTTELTAAGIDPSTTAAALVIRATAALSIRFEPAAVLALVEDSLRKNTPRLRSIKRLGDKAPVQ